MGRRVPPPRRTVSFHFEEEVVSGLGDGVEVPFRVPIGHERVRPSEAAPVLCCYLSKLVCVCVCLCVASRPGKEVI